MRRYAVWMGLFVCFFLSAVPGTAAVDARTSDASELAACAYDSERILSCGTSIVQAQLAGHSPRDVMQFLNENLSDEACHIMGHIVGREVYQRGGNLEDSMAECGYICDGSCIHGLAGTAFLDALGIEVESVGDVHVDVGVIREKGGELCAQSRVVCHGIGHMLFQMYNSFEPALEQCDRIARGYARDDCLRGVFMEHADIVSSHDVLQRGARTTYADPENLLAPCDTVERSYKRACFRYQPRVQSTLLPRDVPPEERDAARRGACETLTEGYDRAVCFEGIGRNLYDEARADASAVRAWCEALGRTRDRAGCLFGVASPIGSYLHVREAFGFCMPVQGAVERASCFSAAVSAIAFAGYQSWRSSDL